jgi:DNA-directed RNA polymerase subunit omega
MVNKPPLSELMQHVDTKYTLVSIAAKRARTMIDNNPDMLHDSQMNPVTLALEEVAEGKVEWQRIKDNIG